MATNGHIPDTNGDKPTPGNSHAWYIREFKSPKERERFEDRYSYLHAHPGSVLIAGIGAMWDPGAWQKVIDMVMYTSEQGYQTWFEEVLPAAGDIMPMADIGYMRDTAVMKALDGGFEYVCLIDSDVLPEPDVLVKLLTHQATMVAPYMVEPGSVQLGYPIWPVNVGLRRMRWVCGSFMLFRPQIFNCPNVMFRASRDDELFFQTLWHYGIYPLMDTDTEVLLTRGPRRHGTRSWNERWHLIRDIYEKSQLLPDRKPVDVNDPNVVDGVYFPATARQHIGE